MVNNLLNKYKGIPVQVRASFWFLICAFLQKGISVITTPLFTRIMTTLEYGQYSVFNSWLGLVTVFISLSLYCGVFTQGIIKFDTERKEYTSSLQGLTLTLVLAWAVIYLIFQDFWNNLLSLTTVQMFAMLSMIWTTAVFSFWSIGQRVALKYKALVIITLIMAVAKPAIGILLVIHANDKVTARIIGLAFIELAVSPFLFVKQMQEGKRFYSKRFWHYAIAFNLPLIPHYLSQTVLNSSDRIMIDKMAGSDAAGIYSLAYSISQIMALFNVALLQTIEPWLYQKIKEKKVLDISKIAYPALLLIAGVNIALIAFAPEVVAIFAPAEYFDAIWIIPPVAMSVYFMFAYTFFAVFEFFYEMTHYVTISTVAGAILNIVLNYIFISHFGYYAAGYTTLLCYILYALLHFYFMQKICKKHLDSIKPYDINKLLLITLVFLGCGCGLLVTYSNIVVRYLLIAVLVMAVFAKHKIIMKMLKGMIGLKRW